jgi:hypothetical protein
MEGNFTTFRAVVEDVFSGGLLGRLIRAGHGVCCISLRLRTRRVIILDQIHPVAHFEAPHQCRVKRLQEVADGVRLLESGVEPLSRPECATDIDGWSRRSPSRPTCFPPFVADKRRKAYVPRLDCTPVATQTEFLTVGRTD